VSELLTLRQGQVNLNQGVIRILGKGNRERLVPPMCGSFSALSLDALEEERARINRALGVRDDDLRETSVNLRNPR